MSITTLRPKARLATGSKDCDVDGHGAPKSPTTGPNHSVSVRLTGIFSRRRTSTTTSISSGKGSFSSRPDVTPTVFQTSSADVTPTIFQASSSRSADEEFGYSTEYGRITSFHRPAQVVTEKKSSSLGLSVQTAESSPRGSDLKSPTGAPIYVGRAAITDDTSSTSKVPSSPKASPRAGTKDKLENDETPHYNFKQSYQSRHKVPDVVKKLIQEDPAFEWPEAPAYATEQEFPDEEDVFDGLPPPPPST